MYSQLASVHPVAGPSITSFIDADGSAVAAMDDRIRFARKSRCFADEAGVTQKQLPTWLDASNARPELSCCLCWLQTLLPGQGEQATVRRGIANLDRLLSDAEQPQHDELVELYGPVKRRLLMLCKKLEAYPCPTTVAAVCRELHPAFGAEQGRGQVAAIAGAIERAVSAAETHSRDTMNLPEVDDVALAMILKQIGADGLRQLYTRLGDSFDRLADLVPGPKNAALRSRLIGFAPKDGTAALRRRLTAWRDRYATPPARFDFCHAEMLDGGHWTLRALCKVLDQMDADKRALVFEVLRYKIPGRTECGSEVSALVNVLIEAETLRDGGDNPRLEERRRLFKSSPLLEQAYARVARNAKDDGMVALGLAIDFSARGSRSEMHPVYNNAAWRVCLANVVGPIAPHPLADVDKAGLVLMETAEDPVALLRRFAG